MQQRKDKHVPHALKSAQMGQRPKHKTMHFEKKMLHLGFGDEFLDNSINSTIHFKKKKKPLTNQTLSKFKTFVLHLKRHCEEKE